MRGQILFSSFSIVSTLSLFLLACASLSDASPINTQVVASQPTLNINPIFNPLETRRYHSINHSNHYRNRYLPPRDDGFKIRRRDGGTQGLKIRQDGIGTGNGNSTDSSPSNGTSTSTADPNVTSTSINVSGASSTTSSGSPSGSSSSVNATSSSASSTSYLIGVPSQYQSSVAEGISYHRSVATHASALMSLASEAVSRDSRMAILSRSSSNFHDQISSIKNEMSSIRAAGVGATATSTGSGTGSGDGSGSDSGSGSVSPSKRGQGVAPIATPTSSPGDA